MPDDGQAPGAQPSRPIRALVVAVCLALAALGVYGLSCVGPVALGPRGRAQHDVDAVTRGSPEIRVLMAGGPAPRIRLSVAGPYRICPLGRTDVLARGDRLEPVEAVCSKTGLKLGDLEIPAPRVEIWPAQDGTVLVMGPGARKPSDSKPPPLRPYRGRLRLVKRPKGLVAAINVVGLEAYLASVANGEMPPPFALGAREAQAIAARTYAIFQMKTFGSSHDFDVHDSVRSQHYPGMAWETDAGWQAVENTRAMVCTYGGKVFCTYYSSCCGGQTADARWVKEFADDAVPPLASVACPYCNHPENTRYQWPPVTITKTDLGRRLGDYFKARGVTIGHVQRLDVADAYPDGRARTVRVVHAKGRIDLPAVAFRSRVMGSRVLRSTRFTVEDKNDHVVLVAKGWGHGVGLCQWGARGLADAGRSAEQIIQFYYPGSQLARAY